MNGLQAHWIPTSIISMKSTHIAVMNSEKHLSTFWFFVKNEMRNIRERGEHHRMFRLPFVAVWSEMNHR